MLLSFAGAVVLAAQPVPQMADDPDLRCLAAVGFAAGALSQRNDPKAAERVSSVMFYFLGRLKARFPAIDLNREVLALVQRPGFAQTLQQETRRCGLEAQARAADLQSLGRQLQGISPR